MNRITLFSQIIMFYISYVNARFNLRHLTYATGMEEPHYLRHLPDYNIEEDFIDTYDTNY